MIPEIRPHIALTDFRDHELIMSGGPPPSLG
jgi:hypothetical protein